MTTKIIIILQTYLDSKVVTVTTYGSNATITYREIKIVYIDNYVSEISLVRDSGMISSGRYTVSVCVCVCIHGLSTCVVQYV